MKRPYRQVNDAQMHRSTDPLVFPPHFPPTTRREKFFIGVRWLGPDLSFFKQLKQQQGERTTDQMKVWGSGKRREVAEQLARGLKKEIRWPTAVFLPADSFEVICNGPALGMLDDLGSVAVIEQFEKSYGVRLPKTFWQGREHATFGEIVEGLAALVASGLE
jgi:hypothetical protein